ncbi:hypothetical protein TWF718_003603 [Orbilia javanica]|uniref:Uncharacterized protein n=1 Tax=Orbilia javanica TaxID=47235 RepID=A0AAN8RF02_9PEZI
MKWPWIHEVREAAEDVYSKIRGAVTPFHAVDWIFGGTLLGEWMALKLMSAVILLTNSVKGQGIAPFYDCGFVTSQKAITGLEIVKARRVGLVDPPDPHDNVIRIGGGGAHTKLTPKPEDIKNLDSFVAEIRDPGNWVLLAVPKTSCSKSEVQGVVLRALPLELDAGIASINFVIDEQRV